MDDANQPATKQDLIDLERRLDEKWERRLEELTRTLTETLTERMQELVHDSETRLLKAFYGFVESTRTHFVELDRADASMRERMAVVEQRLTEVEKRLNMPPAA